MSEWKEIKMEEILVSANTGLDAIKRAPIVEYDSGIKCLRIQDVSQEKEFVNWGFCEVEERNFEKFKLRKGDIIIARTGATVGVNKFIKEDLKSVFNNGLIRLRADREKCLPKYLYFNLRTSYFNSYIESISGGTSTQPNMQINALVDFEMMLPSLREQTVIAEILSSLDDKIDLLHRQNKTLEQLAQTLFRQWFVEEAEESWEVVKVSDVAKINAKTISKNYPCTDIEYLDTGSITVGRISEFQTYKLTDAPSRAQRIVEDYDIVYSLVRPIQRHYGLLHDLKPNTIASTGFCVITCNDFSHHFIYLLLTKNENVEYFNTIAEGSTSTYPSLKPSDIANFEFQKPPKEILERFSKITRDSWEKIKSNTNIPTYSEAAYHAD
jgi:type I restriction enzyme S subunit